MQRSLECIRCGKGRMALCMPDMRIRQQVGEKILHEVLLWQRNMIRGVEYAEEM